MECERSGNGMLVYLADLTHTTVPVFLHTRTQQLRVVQDEKILGRGEGALKAKHYIFVGAGWRGCVFFFFNPVGRWLL